jgi:DNA-binding response OmpR family regulator
MAKILVVDDEPTFCDVVGSMLKEQGHEVVTAHNGNQAIALFKSQHPQFTLLDLRMPEMDGIEVLVQIRQLDPTAPVMIVTAWSSDEKEREAREIGAVDFLSKRLTCDTIIAKMEGLLGKPAKPQSPPYVLLLDDSPQGRDVLQPFLLEHSIDVRLIKDAKMALVLAEQDPPGIIALDMAIGGKVDQWDERDYMKAEAFLQSLRDKKYPGGVVIMAAEKEQKKLMQRPVVDTYDILVKPVDPVRLMLALQVGMILNQGQR